MTALDVAVSFNDIDQDADGSGAKVIGGRRWGFVDQVATLGRSLRRYMPEATLWALHTQPLGAEPAERLAAIGWNVVAGRRADGPAVTDRFHDRLCAYELGTAGQLLLLDADSIVVAPVAFDRRCAVRVGYAGSAVFSTRVWTELSHLVGLRGRLAVPRAFDAYFHLGLRLPAPFFNNGAVLIERTAIPDFVRRMSAAAEAIVASGIVERVSGLGHYLDQVCLSLAVLQTPDRGLLPRGFNTLGSRVDLDRAATRRRVTHYHYLGGRPVTDAMQRYYGELLVDSDAGAADAEVIVDARSPTSTPTVARQSIVPSSASSTNPAQESIPSAASSPVGLSAVTGRGKPASAGHTESG